MHLLTNACQAIEGEGIITIATDVHQGKARIRVSDTGRGIPARGPAAGTVVLPLGGGKADGAKGRDHDA